MLAVRSSHLARVLSMRVANLSLTMSDLDVDVGLRAVAVTSDRISAKSVVVRALTRSLKGPPLNLKADPARFRCCQQRP